MPNAEVIVLDTSVILHSSNALRNFGDREIVIPYVVLEEIDKFKTRDDEVGRNARQAVRFLDELRSTGSLSTGVAINDKGGILRIELNYSEPKSPNLLLNSNDDRILNVCLGLKENSSVTLISKDINLLIRADVFGIKAKDFFVDKSVESISDIYTGTAEIVVEPEIIDKFYTGDKIYYPDLVDTLLYPNQYLTLVSSRDESKTALARVQLENKPLAKLRLPKAVSGLMPRNREQHFLIDALTNKDIPLVSVMGSAGTGKTLTSLACALHLVQDEQVYNRLIVSRPIQPMGKDIGYLPGLLEEKMSPWMGPIKDAINILRGSPKRGKNSIDVFSEMVALGLLEIEPLTYLRGRSFPSTFFLIDEGEDLSRQEVKTIVSRMGENSKIVLIGDIMQITNPYVDEVNNGLSIVAEKFKGYDFAAHLTLVRGERSILSTVASEIL